MTSGANPWLPARRAGGPRLRLFAFPFAGGGGAVFHGLARRVAPAIEVVPVLLPGRERRLQEAPLRSIDALLDALEPALAPELDEPHAFLGHSLGALVAFELARRRRASGRRGPAHLVVSACRAPQRVSVERPIHTLPDDAFLEAIDALGGMPPEVLRHAELVALLLPALRADFEVYETYRFEPGAELDAPITALGGEDDREVPRADLEAWRERTRGPFDVRWLPGGHFFLQEQEERVARAVSEALAAQVGTRS